MPVAPWAFRVAPVTKGFPAARGQVSSLAASPSRRPLRGWDSPGQHLVVWVRLGAMDSRSQVTHAQGGLSGHTVFLNVLREEGPSHVPEGHEEAGRTCPRSRPPPGAWPRSHLYKDGVGLAPPARWTCS